MSKFKCPICLRWFDWLFGENDHITERQHGGEDGPSNVRRICIPCHEARHQEDDGFSLLQKYGNQGHRNQDMQLNFFYRLFKPKQPK